jgi:hypothetical protein
MKTKLRQIAVVLSLLFAGTIHAEDSVRAFLKIDGIQGKSTNAKHAGEIDVAAFKLGVLQSLASGTGGGGGAGKATFAPITIYKGVDRASPLLFSHCATGQHRPQAILTLAENGKDTFTVRWSMSSSLPATRVRIISRTPNCPWRQCR